MASRGLSSEGRQGHPDKVTRTALALHFSSTAHLDENQYAQFLSVINFSPIPVPLSASPRTSQPKPTNSTPALPHNREWKTTKEYKAWNISRKENAPRDVLTKLKREALIVRHTIIDRLTSPIIVNATPTPTEDSSSPAPIATPVTGVAATVEDKSGHAEVLTSLSQPPSPPSNTDLTNGNLAKKKKKKKTRSSEALTSSAISPIKPPAVCSPHNKTYSRPKVSAMATLAEDALIEGDVQNEHKCDSCAEPNCTKILTINNTPISRGSAIRVTKSKFIDMEVDDKGFDAIVGGFQQCFPNYPVTYVVYSVDLNGLSEFELSFTDPMAASKIIHALRSSSSKPKKRLIKTPFGPHVMFDDIVLCPCEAHAQFPRMNQMISDYL